MGAFLEKPKIDKKVGLGRGNGLRFGFCSMQGWRIEMEDAHVAEPELSSPFESWSYFGVFDGHAGSRLSELCASRLLEFILRTDEFVKLKESPDINHVDMDVMKRGIVNGFLAFDREILAENPNEKSGSTAVVVFITPNHIVMANCGDSRAVLVRSDKAAYATEDHKPNNPLEHKRISEAGGQVMLSRVNGSLAVSRSLGDFDYKQVLSRSATEQLVSPEPDIFVIDRQKCADQVLILACDGVWDVYENDSLTEYVLHRLSCLTSLVDVCSEILDTCLHKGSRDNMSVLLVGLDNAPNVDTDAACKDTKLDADIKTIVDDLVNEAGKDLDTLDLNDVLAVIRSMNLDNYPPGGFITKRGYIENIFNARVNHT